MPLSEAQQNQLAKAIQKEIPFTIYPYREVARQLDLQEVDVIDQLKQWSQEDKLREVAGVFEGEALGYKSALAVGKIEESEIERVAAILSEHPTVTHNYRRTHAFNLWFTIAVPAEMGIKEHLQALSQLAGVELFQPMERTHTFKIGVNFDLKAKESTTVKKKKKKIEPIQASERDIRIIRALQTDLPYESRPFALVAEQCGLSEQELLEFGQKHQSGLIRRYGGTFRHRKLGVKGNGMVVWNVEEGQMQEIGEQLASQPEVSHCYARNMVAGFPYNLYSMIHGPDQEHCEGVARRISGQLGMDDYIILFSTHEYKKCRLRYFLPELDQWWQKNGQK